MKRITEQSVAKYQALAQKMDHRHAATKTWAELPLSRTLGRPLKGEQREALTVHSIKMTKTEWRALQAEAKTLGTSVNALIRGVLRPDSLTKVVEAAGLAG